MSKMWSLAEINKTYGTKRRTLLEWCKNGKWAGLAIMHGEGGKRQWLVPDEVVQNEYRYQVIEAGGLPATRSEGSVEALVNAVRPLATAMEDMRTEIVALRQLIETRLPVPQAKRLSIVARTLAILKRDREEN